jgi:hypothetical protein
VRERLVGLYAHHCGRPADVISKAKERDNFMSPEEARAFGLIDEVRLRVRVLCTTSLGSVGAVSRLCTGSGPDPNRDPDPNPDPDPDPDPNPNEVVHKRETAPTDASAPKGAGPPAKGQ